MDVRLQALAYLCRRRLAPHPVDQRIDRNRTPACEQQDGE
jgi:hypothetical protein